jgi:signal transduction histidine kinase
LKILLFFLLVLCFSFSESYSQNGKDAVPEKTRKTADHAEVDRLLLLANQTYLKTGDYRKVDSVCSIAYQMATKTGYKKGQAGALSRMGIAQKYLGNNLEALKSHFSALVLFKELKDSAAMAKTYSNLGTVEKDLGNFPRAIEYQLTSMRLAEKIKDQDGIARASQNLGLVLKLQHQYEEALKYYRVTETVYRKLKDTNQLVKLLNNKIIVFNTLGKLDSSLRQNDEIVQMSNGKWIGTNVNYLLTPVGIHKQLAYNAFKKGDSAAGKMHVREALQKAKTCLFMVAKTGDKSLLGRARAALAGAYKQMGIWDSARTHALEALKIQEKLNNPSYLMGSYKTLSEIDSAEALDQTRSLDDRLFHAREALKYFRLAEITKYKVFNDENALQIQELKVRYEAEKKDQEIALLSKDNRLKSYDLKEKQLALELLRLRNRNNQSEIDLLHKSSDIQALGLSKAQAELKAKTLEERAKAALLSNTEKDKALKAKELEDEVFKRNLILIGALLALVLAYLLFIRFRLKTRLSHQQTILDQRKRLSADLHDDVGATLSSISIYTEAIKTKLKNNEPERVMELVAKIGENSRETISTLGDIVWNLNPINDSAERLFNRMESTASMLLSVQNSALGFQTDPQLLGFDFSLEAKQNLYLIFKEVINNAAKYARAQEVQVNLRKAGNDLELHISDNGLGFDTTQQAEGNGLRNIQIRTEVLGGTATVVSSPSGTDTLVKLPLNRLAKA